MQEQLFYITWSYVDAAVLQYTVETTSVSHNQTWSLGRSCQYCYTRRSLQYSIEKNSERA